MNIVEPIKSSKKNAYNLAKELIIKCSETLESYIQNVCHQKKYRLLAIIELGVVFILECLILNMYTLITVFQPSFDLWRKRRPKSTHQPQSV